MHNTDKVSIEAFNELRSDVSLLRRQLFEDDISTAKNRSWVFKQKLKHNETFSDFGCLVTIRISEYQDIVREYGSNVGNRLLKQASDYMIHYMTDNHLQYEIVRYMEDNFLIFIHQLNEYEVEEEIMNMQNGMSNYKFKHRNRMFQLTCHAAVMQYIENESFSSVLEQLDEKLFESKM